MEIKPIIAVIEKVAPVLATALGSPIAGIILHIIANVFDANFSDPNDILNKINADPDSALKLKALQYQHEENLKKIASQNYQTTMQDKQSARNFPMDFKADIVIFLTVSFFISYTGVLLYSIYHPTHQLDLIMDHLQNIMLKIIDYFFGSSQVDVTSL